MLTIHGYHVGEMIRCDGRSRTYRVADGTGLVLKVVEGLGPTVSNDPGLVDSFAYTDGAKDMHCLVYKEDYFECCYASVKYDALKTPTPYGGMQPATLGCDDDSDYDNDNEGDDNNDSDDDDDDDDDVEVNIIVNQDNNVAPILHRESTDVKEHIHFAHNPLLAKICHRQHRPIVRTPVPRGAPAEQNEQNLTCQKEFKLEMVQSSMLKRRSTSSAGRLV